MKDRARELLRRSLDDERADFRSGQWECMEPLLQNKWIGIILKPSILPLVSDAP